MVLKINGDIVPNDMKEIYAWFGLDCSCPNDVHGALEALPEGDRLEIKINSHGGYVEAGKEMYTTLRNRNDVDIEVESIAASAASMIAMAGHSTISPVGMLMIHDVSATASGNKRDMKKMAEDLQRYDESIAEAYSYKTGMSVEEVLKLMDKETYIPAQRAVELGFIDAISEAKPIVTNGIGGVQVTDAMIEEYKAAKAAEAEQAKRDKAKAELLNDLDNYGI
jgi:ATP-dependent protease ClpP protease subunit